MLKGEEVPHNLHDSMDKRDAHTATWSSFPKREPYYQEGPDHVQVRNYANQHDRLNSTQANAQTGEQDNQQRSSDLHHRQFIDNLDGTNGFYPNNSDLNNTLQSIRRHQSNQSMRNEDFPSSSPPSESTQDMSEQKSAESNTSEKALWKELQDLRQRLERIEDNRYGSKSSTSSTNVDRTLEISKDLLQCAGQNLPPSINRRLHSLTLTCEDIYTSVRTGSSPTEDQVESMMQGLINLTLGLSAGQNQDDSLLRRATSVRSPLPVPSRSLARSHTSSRLRSVESTTFQEDDEHAVQRGEVPSISSSRGSRMFYSSPPPVPESAAARLRRSSCILREETIKDDERGNRYGGRLEGVASSETLQGNNNRQRRIPAMLETPSSRLTHYSRGNEAGREKSLTLVEPEYQNESSVLRPRASFLDSINSERERPDELDGLDSSALRRRSFILEDSTPPPVRRVVSGRGRPHSMIFSRT